MSAVTPPSMSPPWFAWVVVPLSAAGYQIAAKTAADQLGAAPFSRAWLAAALGMPSVWSLLACEGAGFIAWMSVLAKTPLSAAFPLSATSYVLVLGAGWSLFHEPARPLQSLGALAILAGAWTIASGRKEPR